MTIEKATMHCGQLFLLQNLLKFRLKCLLTFFSIQTLCNITPPYAERRGSRFAFMKVSCYVTVDDRGNYVTFHELNIRIKINKITKAQSDSTSVSNREF